MPTSHWMQLNEIMGLIMSVRPKSILDVGIGFGKFGVLVREYLELWDGRNVYSDFKCRIDGIEIHDEYRTPLHDWVYNNIFYGDALDIVPTLARKYDLSLLIDVIEHFDKDKGNELLSSLLHRSNAVIVATPHKPSAQGAAFGNVHETHKSVWTPKELDSFGESTLIPNGRSVICLIRGKHD